MSSLDIYFGGSISGGREYVNRYQEFCEHLQQYGNILTEHVADPSLDSTGEDLSKKEVYERDMRLMDNADLLIADVSTPSPSGVLLRNVDGIHPTNPAVLNNRGFSPSPFYNRKL
jgi:hypothetical protein